MNPPKEGGLRDGVNEVVLLRQAAEHELRELEKLIGPIPAVYQESVRTAFKGGAAFGADRAKVISNTPRWISVKDRMPAKWERVIVEGGIGYYWDECNGWYTVTGFNEPGKPIQWHVSHWMPIPKLDEAHHEN